MYNKDGTAKYTDMKDTFLPDFLNLSKGQETKGAAFLIPPKFLKNPVVKYINDQISINKQKTDTIVEQILYDPMFASDKLLAPGREKGKSFSDYMLRLNSTAEVLRLAGMRKIKTDGGALTRFDLMRLKNPEKAANLVNESFRIEIDKLREAKKNKEDYSTRIDLNEQARRTGKKEVTEADLRRVEELRQSRTEENFLEIDAEINTILGIDPFLPVKEGGFKYEVTDRELQTKYKFDREMIDIYRSLRGAVDKVVDYYNQKVKDNKADGLEQIQKIPNYFPHIFTGDFAIFLKKWSKVIKMVTDP
jgi:hypothetical protein